MISVYLPYPPTANNLFLNVGKRRVRTKRYDAWIAEALADIARQKPGRVCGAYRMALIATRPDRRARDVENLLKPTSDLLKKAGVIEDDSKAERVSAEWRPGAPEKGAPVLVFLEAA